MEPTVELRYDARQADIRFAPLGNGRFILCAPGDISVSLYISEAQALSLYKLLRLYLRNPLTRWGPGVAEEVAAMGFSRSAARRRMQRAWPVVRFSWQLLSRERLLVTRKPGRHAVPQEGAAQWPWGTAAPQPARARTQPPCASPGVLAVRATTAISTETTLTRGTFSLAPGASSGFPGAAAAVRGRTGALPNLVKRFCSLSGPPGYRCAARRAFRGHGAAVQACRRSGL